MLTLSALKDSQHTVPYFDSFLHKYFAQSSIILSANRKMRTTRISQSNSIKKENKSENYQHIF
jgi:hypothetical protein